MKIAIASGKGGTGKTTLSTNLSAYLAEREKVVLTDLDVEEPNSGLFIKGELQGEELQYKEIPTWNKEACSLCGECQEVCNFNAIIQLGDQIMVFPELCHSCHACSGLCPEGALPMMPEDIGSITRYKYGSLDFVESRLKIGEEATTALIQKTNAFIDKHYSRDTIKIFDSPPGTSCPVMEATKDVDFVVLITEPTPFGLHDLKLAVETMRDLGKKFGLVINRYGLGNDDVLDYCKTEKIAVLAKFANSRKIAELYSGGDLLYDKVPEFKAELIKLWENIGKEVKA